MKYVGKLFGVNLKRLIERGKMKQSEVAERLEIPAPTVSRWSTGEFLPEDANFKKLCDFLKAQPEEFFLPNPAWIEANKTKPSIETFTEQNAAVGDAAAFLAKFVGLEPLEKRVILGLAYRDSSYMRGVKISGKALRELEKLFGLLLEAAQK